MPSERPINAENFHLLLNWLDTDGSEGADDRGGLFRRARFETIAISPTLITARIREHNVLSKNYSFLTSSV